MTRFEQRSFTQATPQTIMEIFGLETPAGVSMERALGVPAVWAAVNFIAGTIAGLPLHVYERKADGQKHKVKDTAANPAVSMLHDAVNDDLTSFQWRYDLYSTGILTEGRAVTYIERDSAGRAINLFPLERPQVKRLDNGRKEYRTGRGARARAYDQSEVLDLTYCLKPDLVSHRSPIRQCAVAIGKAAHAAEFGSKIFNNGGMPPYALEGPFQGPDSASRAGANVEQATQEVVTRGGLVLPIPQGHRLVPLGSDPDKLQLVEAQRFAVEEIARIYGLPPVFLQDLTHGTFANTEQQALQFVKFYAKRWIEQFEAEMNLKLFGRRSRRFVEFNLDGLLRGDYTSRMEGNARAIQTGQLTPNEARVMDNRPEMDGGGRLYIQGATVPLTQSKGVANGQ
ncbi:MAG: phage portal protein [Pseudomonadota bacterium]